MKRSKVKSVAVQEMGRGCDCQEVLEPATDGQQHCHLSKRALAKREQGKLLKQDPALKSLRLTSVQMFQRSNF
jgi:hypothetical protein